jgi:hypothetical protein
MHIRASYGDECATFPLVAIIHSDHHICSGCCLGVSGGQVPGLEPALGHTHAAIPKCHGDRGGE